MDLGGGTADLVSALESITTLHSNTLIQLIVTVSLGFLIVSRRSWNRVDCAVKQYSWYWYFIKNHATNVHEYN